LLCIPHLRLAKFTDFSAIFIFSASAAAYKKIENLIFIIFNNNLTMT